MNVACRSAALALVTAGIALFLGCEATTSTALRRREQIKQERSKREPWVQRWQQAQLNPSWVKIRLELAFDFKRDPQIQQSASPGVTAEQVENVIQQDIATLLDGTSAVAQDGDTLWLAARWKQEVDRDPKATRTLACRAADATPRFYAAQLTCGDLTMAETQNRTEAIRHWKAAYPSATTPEEQCQVVNRIAPNSMEPERDMDTISRDVIARCQRAPAPITSPMPSAAAPQPSGSPSAPTAPSETTAAPGPAPTTSMAPILSTGVPTGPVQDGMQIQANLLQQGIAAGTASLAMPVQVGFHTGQLSATVGVFFSMGASPSTGVAGTTTLTLIGAAPSVRYYVTPPRALALSPYVQAEVDLAQVTQEVVVGSTRTSASFAAFGVGGAGGVEFPLTPNFGVSADLGLRYFQLIVESSSQGAPFQLATTATGALVFHF
jgi:hypothetical protein